MKTLRRSKEHRIIAGVCGGIAEYFSIDPVLIRLIFLVMAVFGGAGIILYIVAWIIMPERGTNDDVQDAEVVDDSQKKTSDKIKNAIKNVAGEFVEDVAKEFAQDIANELKSEFDDAGKEAEVEVETEVKKELKKRKKHKKSSGVWFGIFLVFLGIAFLLRTFGWLDFSWHGIWKYWPILLIILGISCISMKRWLKNTLMILSLAGLLFALIWNSHASCRDDVRHRQIWRAVSISVSEDAVRITAPGALLSVSEDEVIIKTPGTPITVETSEDKKCKSD
ncbi:MAG: PspC domain-containing protein [Bacteroidales bacterium]|nr:PspC domain-containing protein [Bacteroidales bacterium]